MPLFFIDPPMPFYYLLIFIAMIGLFIFYKNQTKKSLMTFVALSLPLLALLAIDYSEESTREQIVRRIQAIAAATREKKLDDAFANVSEAVNYRGHDKASLKERGRSAYAVFDWQGASVWDFTREEFTQVNDTTATQGFMAKPAEGQGIILYCKVTFQKEKDGQWRVTDFKFYNPINRDKGSEETVPGL